MEFPLRVGLLGCGRVARKHLAALGAHPDFALDTVVAPRPDQARQTVCEILGKAKADRTRFYASLEEWEDAMGPVSRREDGRSNYPEVLAITTPSDLHAPQGLWGLEHGCHLLLEKPMALSLADCRALEEKAAEKGLLISMAHIYRYFPFVPELRQNILRGCYGKLLHAHFEVLWGHDEAYYKAGADWRGKWERDGGVLMNQCVHALDLLFYLTDMEPVSCTADLRQAVHHGLEAEDTGIVMGTLENGAPYSLFGTTASSPKDHQAWFVLEFTEGTIRGGLGGKKPLLEITGEPGVSKYYGLGVRSLMPRCLGGTGSAGTNLQRMTHPHHAYYADLAEALREGRQPRANARAGRKSVEAILAAYRSAREGGARVSFPLPDEAAAAEMVGFKPEPVEPV